MKYKCQCGALVKAGDDHYCRAYPDKLLARIAELEKLHSENLDEMRLHYEDVHAEEVNDLNARIAELEKSAIVWHKYPDEKPPIDGRYLFWDSDGNAPHVLPHNDIVVRDNPSVFSTQTHWAYLPKPPEVKG